MTSFATSLLGRATLIASLIALACAGAGCAADDDELSDETELEVKGGKKKGGKGDGKKDDGKKDDGKKDGDKTKETGRRFEVLTHNIGGGAENDGGPAGISYTLSRIEATNPDVVMLEEVCYAQYEAFVQKFPGWTVLYAPMTQNVGGTKCGGTPKGQLLASPRAMTEEIRQDLGDPDGDKHFTLLCGAVPIPDTARKVLSCVTHLRAEGNDAAAADAARKRQVWRIANLLNPRAGAGQAVVLAGDLNASPGKATLDDLYRLTRFGNYNGGRFDEADQTDPQREQYAGREEVRCAADACRSGEGTMSSNNAKLDHVFFSHNRIAGEIGATPEGSGGSGHKLYRAWAKLDL